MCHQKKSDGASLQSEMACLDCLITKTGPKWVRKGLMDLSTMFHGCTHAGKYALNNLQGEGLRMLVSGDNGLYESFEAVLQKL